MGPDTVETILVVEDSDTVRALVCAILRQFGYSVLEAEDPAQAIGTCEREGGSIDLLLTDVMMPGMTGLELYERLSAEFPRLKALFISGYTGEAALEEGMIDEKSAFLQKPFSPDTLADAVRAVLDG